MHAVCRWSAQQPDQSPMRGRARGESSACNARSLEPRMQLHTMPSRQQDRLDRDVLRESKGSVVTSHLCLGRYLCRRSRFRSAPSDAEAAVSASDGESTQGLADSAGKQHSGAPEPGSHPNQDPPRLQAPVPSSTQRNKPVVGFCTQPIVCECGEMQRDASHRSTAGASPARSPCGSGSRSVLGLLVSRSVLGSACCFKVDCFPSDWCVASPGGHPPASESAVLCLYILGVAANLPL